MRPHRSDQIFNAPTQIVGAWIHSRSIPDHNSRDGPEAAVRGRNFVDPVIQFRKSIPIVDLGIEIHVWRVPPDAKVSDVMHRFSQHRGNFLRPNIGLNVDKNGSVKAIKGSIPLIGKIRVVAKMLPVRMTESETIVGVDYPGFHNGA